MESVATQSYKIKEGLDIGANINKAMFGAIMEFVKKTPFYYWDVVVWQILGGCIVAYIVFWLWYNFYR